MDNLKNLFKNKELLDQAFTHKSWVNEHPNVRESNERLEFLGDAILEFIITENIYAAFPKNPEGYLTALRANLVNTKNLAELALKLNVGPQIFLSKGEEDGGGRANPSLLADTVEAIIGALYLDQGIDATREFIRTNLIAEIPAKVAQPLKDPKSRLQEYVQAKGLPAPKYKVVEEVGPDHNKSFVVEVIIDNQSQGRGSGKSKSLAQQAAAEIALDKIAKNS
jgi:ribonuclease III